MRHRDIEDSDILTRRQIGLQYQSHYAHEGMTAEVAVPSPDSSQLRDQAWSNQF
jgi:hypothetical protein